MKLLGLIPARLASTRLPEKALEDIGGKKMIQRVYERAVQSSCLSHVVVATDHKKIADFVQSFGGNVCMTREDHSSGTDRCFEALKLQQESFDYIINIQGDEPFIKPEQIDLLGSTLDGSVEIATLGKTIQTIEELESEGEVKITMNTRNEALYFSRAIIPFVVPNTADKNEWLKKFRYFKHVGMYAYRSDILEQITRLQVSSLEKAERLEQLRWLENGFKVSIIETTEETFCIDTYEDLAKARLYIANNPGS